MNQASQGNRRDIPTKSASRFIDSSAIKNAAQKDFTHIIYATKFVGLVGAVVPFVKSMNPSAAAGSALPHIDISSLKDGSFLVQKAPIRGYHSAQCLVIRDHDSKLYVYSVPVREGQVILPDVDWWHWGGLCSAFGPEMEGDSIKKNGVIRCHDEHQSEYSDAEWRWSYNGKNLGKYTSAMETPKYMVIGKYVVLDRI